MEDSGRRANRDVPAGLAEATSLCASCRVQDVSELELCKDHPLEAIKFLCHAHGQLCCRNCVVLNHRKCNVSYISDFAHILETRREFKVDKVEKLETDSNTWKRILPSDEQSVLDISKVPMKKLREYRVEINEYLDRQEKALVESIDYARNKNADLKRKADEGLEIKPNRAKLDDTCAERESIPDRAKLDDTCAERDSITDRAKLDDTCAERESIPDRAKLDNTCVKRESIPDKAKLNAICEEKGRKSDEVFALTNRICDIIKEKLDSHFTARNLKTKVVDIYASYPIKYENSIVFVITITNKVQEEVIMQVLEYAFVLKSLESSGIESEMNEVEFEHVLPQEDTCKLNQCVSNNSKRLFQCHSNLRIVTGSRVNVSQYAEQRGVCIQLFVHAKGFIPLREEPFSKQYDDLAVRVSEGVCFLYTNKTATERHDELKIGCQIMRAELFDPKHLTVNGTLGGFFDHPEYGFCGISCAHVLLSNKDLALCKENGGDVHYPIVNASVYQPDCTESNKVGHLVQAIYDEGNENESGIEIAIFNITDRQPLSGAFPAMNIEGQVVSHFKTYNTGTTIGRRLLSGKQVWKFGKASQLTNGCVGDFICSVTVPPLKYDSHGHSLTLLNQLRVHPRSKKIKFAENGDSGALVFYDMPNGDSVCIGMVVGGWNTREHVAAVMPIDIITRQLGVQQLKTFFKGLFSEDIADLRSKLNKTNENVGQINSKMDELLRRTSSS